MITYDIDKQSGELITINIPEPEGYLPEIQNKNLPEDEKQKIYKKQNKENILNNLHSKILRNQVCEFLDYSSECEKNRKGVYLAMLENKEINLMKRPPAEVPDYEAEKIKLQQAIDTAMAKAEYMENEIVALEKNRDYKSAQLKNESKKTILYQAERSKLQLNTIIKNEPAEIERHITELNEFIDFVMKAVVNPYKKKIKDAELRLANLQKKNEKS